MALPYFSAREVILIAQTAYKIYNAYRKSPREFQVLAREGLTLEVALKSAVEEAEKTFPGDQLSTQYRTRLAHLAIGAKELLNELDALLKKYESLLTNKYSKWDRLLFGKEDVEKLRGRIAFHAAAIHGFQTDMVKLRTDGIGVDVKQILEILIQAKSREEAITSTPWREANTQGLYEALEKRGVSQEFMTQNNELIVDLIVDVVKRKELSQEQSTTADSRLWGFPAGNDAREEIILGDITLPCTCGAECTGECLRSGLSPSLTLTDWTTTTAVNSPTSQSPIEEAKEVKQSILHAVSKKLQQVGSTSVAHDGVPFQSPLTSTGRPSICSADSRSTYNNRLSTDESLGKRSSIASTTGSLSSSRAPQRDSSRAPSIESSHAPRKHSTSSTSKSPTIAEQPAPRPPPKAPKSVFSALSKFASGIGGSSYSLAEKSGGFEEFV